MSQGLKLLEEAGQILKEVTDEVEQSGRILTAEEIKQLDQMRVTLREMRDDIIRNSALTNKQLAVAFNLSEARISQIRGAHH